MVKQLVKCLTIDSRRRYPAGVSSTPTIGRARSWASSAALIATASACSLHPGAGILHGAPASDRAALGSDSPCTLITLTSVAPSATNSALGTLSTEPSADDCTGLPTAKPNGKLFVFLPGSGAVPAQYQDVLQAAQALGYHVIGLSYPNGATSTTNLLARDLSDICGYTSATDLPCWTAVRANRFRAKAEPAGTPTDPYKVTVAADAIQGRLESLLHYLGWSGYLTSTGLPKYTGIVFGGHSQGGGEAAYIGTQAVVAGVVMFSSPDDALDPSTDTATCTTGPTEVTQSASWVGAAGHTSLSRYYGLVSCSDPGFTRVNTVWTDLKGTSATPGLGAYGAPAAVASGDATPRGTHQFWSEFPTPIGSIASLWQHDSTVLDLSTPTCPGTTTPALLPIWDEMLIGAGGLTGTPPPTIC